MSIGIKTPLLEISNVIKSFPGVLALSDISLNFYPGEVHALVGENGAGKSTLIKIITGAYELDQGTIKIKGIQVETMNPSTALKNGIHAIYQENTLVPHLSVSENIFLSDMQKRENKLWMNWESIDLKSRNLLDYLGANINIKRKAIKLDIAEQQIVQIAKAILMRGDVLILDEPTASFSREQIQNLFNLIQTLRDKGKCIIFISHHLDEVLEIADRITVLRDGLKIGTYSRGEVSQDELITKMIGKKIDKYYSKKQAEFGPITLHVKKIHKEGKLDNISFYARAGEILGIYGKIGSGQTSLSRILIGREKSNIFDVSLRGKQVSFKSPNQAIENGVILVPEDRRKFGLVMDSSIKENIILAGLFNIHGLFIRAKDTKEISTKFIEELQIKTPNADRRVKFLSGGNQQKVVFAKWIFANSDVLILYEPTRGIDVGAKQQIYQILTRLTKQGKTIILITSEIPELTNLSDRVLVIRSGCIVAELNDKEINKEDILRYSLSQN